MNFRLNLRYHREHTENMAFTALKNGNELSRQSAQHWFSWSFMINLNLFKVLKRWSSFFSNIQIKKFINSKITLSNLFWKEFLLPQKLILLACLLYRGSGLGLLFKRIPQEIQSPHFHWVMSVKHSRFSKWERKNCLLRLWPFIFSYQWEIQRSRKWDLLILKTNHFFGGVHQ